MRRVTRAVAATVLICAAAVRSPAAEIGHFNGGLLNIRDYFVPQTAGVYGAIYNYLYTTDRLNDRNGDEIHSVTLHPKAGPGATANVNVNVDLYALVPAIIWVPDWNPFGLKFGALIAPTFANASLEAALSVATNLGGTVEAGSFGVGDLFVQPLWIGWAPQHFDLAFAYGFYAPAGRYDTTTELVRGGGTIEVEDSDNLGYGFWTQQLQASGAWYPWTNKATAVVTALTYENHQDKKDFDLEPGDNLTLNWGISQFLPLWKDHTLLVEVGPAGYDSWQITDDSGSDASNQVHDQVHGVGGQLGLAHVPWSLAVTFHAFHEFSSEDRFQGNAFGLSVAKKIF
jgi:hypothetical protein